MTRMSKQGERRNTSPRRPKAPSSNKKTGPKKDNLKHGHCLHENIVLVEGNVSRFIPKIA